MRHLICWDVSTCTLRPNNLKWDAQPQHFHVFQEALGQHLACVRFLFLYRKMVLMTVPSLRVVLWVKWDNVCELAVISRHRGIHTSKANRKVYILHFTPWPQAAVASLGKLIWWYVSRGNKGRNARSYIQLCMLSALCALCQGISRTSPCI